MNTELKNADKKILLLIFIKKSYFNMMYRHVECTR